MRRGARDGGRQSSFHQHGHEVALYAPEAYASHVADVAEAGGIHATGGLEGFAPVRYAGTDVAEAMAGAELVVVVGPAYATDPLSEAAAPRLADGMAVLVCPGSCAGALAFQRAAGLEPARILRAADAEAAHDLLVPRLGPGDVVLVKASRGIELDRLVETLREELGS